jgi:hypothetical protein
MDEKSLTELELISRFIKTVKDKKSEIVKIKILGTDAHGLSKMIISASEVPCLPSWPKPRRFACPGVKLVNGAQHLHHHIITLSGIQMQ